MEMQAQRPKDTAEDIKQAFNVFDKDGNGTISTEELQFMITKIGELAARSHPVCSHVPVSRDASSDLHVLWCAGEALTEEECKHMIAAVDANRDGSIDLAEFTAMM